MTKKLLRLQINPYCVIFAIGVPFIDYALFQKTLQRRKVLHQL